MFYKKILILCICVLNFESSMLHAVKSKSSEVLQGCKAFLKPVFIACHDTRKQYWPLSGRGSKNNFNEACGETNFFDQKYMRYGLKQVAITKQMLKKEQLQAEQKEEINCLTPFTSLFKVMNFFDNQSDSKLVSMNCGLD